MPPSSPRVPIGAIRDAAALAVERESLRKVARQVGLSPNGLKQFLSGRRPYTSTEQKLNAWYAAHGRDHGGGGSRLDSARAAVAILLEDFPAQRRAAMEARIYDLLAAGHREDRREPPEWLAAVREPA
jgi:hypothetical protein